MYHKGNQKRLLDSRGESSEGDDTETSCANSDRLHEAIQNSDSSGDHVQSLVTNVQNDVKDEVGHPDEKGQRCEDSRVSKTYVKPMTIVSRNHV